MAEKYQNKYRIPSARLKNWDYGSESIYFVTICTQNRQHYFGEIINDEMQLSELGKWVVTEWVKTPDIRPDMNLILDAFVVMPNHFHAIVIIGVNEYNSRHNDRNGGRDAMHRVSTVSPTITQSTGYKNKFKPQSKNLASIIRGFKSSITSYARKNDIKFQWQSRFYDHIIRNDKSYNHIVNYIVNNPQNWDTDKLKD